MLFRIFFPFALLFSFCAAANYAVNYEYSGNSCSGRRPISAGFQLLQTCFSFTQGDGKLVGTKLTVTNNVGSQTVYENSDCTGNVVSFGNFATINNCSASPYAPFNAVITVVESKFSSPPGSSDLITQYFSSQNCGGRVLGGSIAYSSGCNATKSCLNSTPNSVELPSGNTICGTGYDLPNSSSSLLFSFSVLFSVVLVTL